MHNFREFLSCFPLVRRIKRMCDKYLRRTSTPSSYPRDRIRPTFPGAKHKIGNDRVCDRDTFVLYRIIGNDLVPRHEKGQSRKNLEFILQHESALKDCDKRFVLNRIVDKDEESEIVKLLDSYGMPYIRIPFDHKEYRSVGWDVIGVPVEYSPYSSGFGQLPASSKAAVMMRIYRHKNNYVMNNNGARNTALRDGRKRAKWILPWDGNCFLTEAGWVEIINTIKSKSQLPYHFVPMARITDNQDLIDPRFAPEAVEEPQIVFRADAREEFNSEYFYGRRPKVELFWRLGFGGKWDDWPIEPWDFPCPKYSSEAGHYSVAGWVARLFSGKADLEKQGDLRAWVGRGEARNEAVLAILDELDVKENSDNLQRTLPIFLNISPNDQTLLQEQLRQYADSALDRGPYSVVDKSSLPPSGDLHDYWHPAPYYWPNPLRIPGLPYIRRDGKRVPGTQLYEPLSDRYDRTRLQRLFDDVYVLMLAWRCFGDEGYARHASSLVRCWFLDSETAMNPHLESAQVRLGHNRNRGTSHGIIEFKDLYYFLDAVRLLRTNSFLSGNEISQFEDWLGQYLHWLRSSRQGVEERAAKNNHGTYYDLQVSAICSFLGEVGLLRDTLRDSRFRIIEQFDGSGKQPNEICRATSAHYCAFNLQGWIHLAQIAQSAGEDLWEFSGPSGNGIRSGIEWFISHIGKPWPYRQTDYFDTDRFFPILQSYLHVYGDSGVSEIVELPEPSHVKSIFFPHDGIRPFWNISISSNLRIHTSDKSRGFLV